MKIGQGLMKKAALLCALLFSSLGYSNVVIASNESAHANQLYVDALEAVALQNLDVAYDDLTLLQSKYAESDAASVSKALLTTLTPLVFKNNLKLDSAKYPQDSFQHVLESAIKAFENNDFAYFITYLRDPKRKQYSAAQYQQIIKKVDPRVSARNIAFYTQLLNGGSEEKANSYFNRSYDQKGSLYYHFIIGRDKESRIAEDNGRFYIADF